MKGNRRKLKLPPSEKQINQSLLTISYNKTTHTHSKSKSKSGKKLQLASTSLNKQKLKTEADQPSDDKIIELKKIVYEFRNNIDRYKKEERELELVEKQKRSGVNLLGIYLRKLIKKQTCVFWKMEYQ